MDFRKLFHFFMDYPIKIPQCFLLRLCSIGQPQSNPVPISDLNPHKDEMNLPLPFLFVQCSTIHRRVRDAFLKSLPYHLPIYHKTLIEEGKKVVIT